MALLASTLPAGTKYATPQELLSLFAENLSVPASDANIFVLSPTAPNDQTKIWIDTSGANPLLKIYLSGGWTSISVGSAFSGGLSVTGGNIRLLATALSIDNTGTYAGRVGIGTITPDTTLHVAGTAKATTSVVTPAIAATAGTLAITGAVTTTAGITIQTGDLAVSVGSITCPAGSVSATSLNVGTGSISGGSLSLTAASINSAGLLTAANITTTGALTAASVVLPSITTSTTAAADTPSGPALPSHAVGWIHVTINGTVRRIPYYPTT
jgi:hypothetical protein